LQTFAAHIGVSERMVSKWEAGGETISPRPVNQAALDTSLARSSTNVQDRFAVLITLQSDRVPGQRVDAPPELVETNQVRHPTDGRLMVYVEEGTFLAGPNDEPNWLPGYWIDVFPITNADYARFSTATGHPVPRYWSDGRYPEGKADH